MNPWNPPQSHRPPAPRRRPASWPMPTEPPCTSPTPDRASSELPRRPSDLLFRLDPVPSQLLHPHLNAILRPRSMSQHPAVANPVPSPSPATSPFTLRSLLLPTVTTVDAFPKHLRPITSPSPAGRTTPIRPSAAPQASFLSATPLLSVAYPLDLASQGVPQHRLLSDQLAKSLEPLLTVKPLAAFRASSEHRPSRPSMSNSPACQRSAGFGQIRRSKSAPPSISATPPVPAIPGVHSTPSPSHSRSTPAVSAFRAIHPMPPSVHLINT